MLRLVPLSILAALAAIPAGAIDGLPAFCPWRAVLGFECLGCGMTRALSSALHGDVGAALAFNRGVAIVLPALVAAAVAGVRDMLPRCASRSLDWIPPSICLLTARTNQPPSTLPPPTI